MMWLTKLRTIQLKLGKPKCESTKQMTEHLCVMSNLFADLEAASIHMDMATTMDMATEEHTLWTWQLHDCY